MVQTIMHCFVPGPQALVRLAPRTQAIVLYTFQAFVPIMNPLYYQFEPFHLNIKCTQMYMKGKKTNSSE